MDKFIFGRTRLEISRTGFGMLPLQRISFDDARALLRRARTESGCRSRAEQTFPVALPDKAGTRERTLLQRRKPACGG